LILTINHTDQNQSCKKDLISVSEHSSSILNAKTDGRYHWKGTGSLSFKYAVQGEARYKLEERYLLTESSSFLILNHEQPYEIFVESKLATETFCIFFGQPLVDDVFLNAIKSSEQVLEMDHIPDRPDFFERTHHISSEFLAVISELKLSINNEKDLERTKELLHSFLFRLIVNEYDRPTESANLKSIKKSTRQEIFRRVTIARDYVRAMYADAVTLERLAQVSCLSPNHLLRSFKQVFGISPIQYLNQLRLEKAKRLLLQTSLPIQEVCNEVGYSSLGTFSNHFRRTVGQAPTCFRLEGKLTH